MLKKKKSIGKYDPFSREKTKWRPSPRRPIFGINLKGFYNKCRTVLNGEKENH